LDQVRLLLFKVIKSNLLKKLFTGTVLIFVTFYIKDSSIAYFILNLFNLNNTEFNLYFLSGFLALTFRLFLNSMFDLFFEIHGEYIIPGNNYEDSLKAKRPISLNNNSDSGDPNSPSASNDPLSPSNNIPSASGSAEASSSTDPHSSIIKPLHGKGVINDSDYEWESDNSIGGVGHGYSSDDSNSGQESQVSKFINSIDFESRVKRATLDELSEALTTIDQAKSLYENSTVPSKNEQIALLTKKEAICLAEIEQKLIEMENSAEKAEVQDKGKGKGKEIEK
jgi:hypothetical protein